MGESYLLSNSRGSLFLGLGSVLEGQRTSNGDTAMWPVIGCDRVPRETMSTTLIHIPAPLSAL
jgi:hypothetical protein